MSDTYPTAPIHRALVRQLTLREPTHTDEEALAADDDAPVSEAAHIIRATASTAGAAYALAPVKRADSGITLHRAVLDLNVTGMLPDDLRRPSVYLELVIASAPKLIALDAVLSVDDENEADEETRVRLPDEHPLVIAAVAVLRAEATRR